MSQIVNVDCQALPRSLIGVDCLAVLSGLRIGRHYKDIGRHGGEIAANWLVRNESNIVQFTHRKPEVLAAYIQGRFDQQHKPTG